MKRPGQQILTPLLGEVRFVSQAEKQELGDHEIAQDDRGFLVAERARAQQQHDALREAGQDVARPGVQEQLHADGHEFRVVAVGHVALFAVQQEGRGPRVRFGLRADGVGRERREARHALFVPGGEEERR